MNNFIHWFSEDYWTSIDAVITIGTLFGVWYNYKEDKKKQKLENEDITIKLKVLEIDKIINIEPPIVRKFFSRSEFQGVLGNQLIKGVTRYDIDYLNTQDYYNQLKEIQTDDKQELIIDIKNDEIAQFTDIIFEKIDIRKDKIDQKIIKNIETFIGEKTDFSKKLNENTKKKVEAIKNDLYKTNI